MGGKNTAWVGEHQAECVKECLLPMPMNREDKPHFIFQSMDITYRYQKTS